MERGQGKEGGRTANGKRITGKGTETGTGKETGNRNGKREQESGTGRATKRVRKEK